MWQYLILFVISVLFLDYLLVDQRKLELVKKIPGPSRLPIIGCIYIYFGLKPEHYFAFVKNESAKYGNILRIWVANKLEFQITDPKFVEVILTSTKYLTKSNLYNLLLPWLGTGLLISTDKKWFDRRKVITPAFHFKILEQYFDIFLKYNEILVENVIKPKATGEMQKMFPIITLNTLDIMCESAMGTVLNAQLNSNSEYVQAVKTMCYVIPQRFLNPFLRFEFLFKLTKYKKSHDKALKVLHDFTISIIEKRRQEMIESGLSNKSSTEIESDSFGVKKKMAFLDVLLMSTIDGNGLTNTEIQNEVDTFMFEGHDTSTNAICFTLYLIAKHRNTQKKLIEEIESVIGKDNPLTFKNVQDLKYLDLVCKESLRIFPPVPIMSRRLMEEVPYGDLTLPKDSNYNLYIYGMHHDSKNFPNPEQFIPERFNETISPFSYLPFSAGSRNCIGQKFALLEVKSTLVALLRNFEILTDPNFEPKLEIGLTLKSSNDILIGFKPRM